MLSDIVADLPKKQRMGTELGEPIHGLLGSISSDGLHKPLTVIHHPKQLGKYRLVIGHRRLRAALVLGLSRAVALVLERIPCFFIIESNCDHPRASNALIAMLWRRVDEIGTEETAELLRIDVETLELWLDGGHYDPSIVEMLRE